MKLKLKLNLFLLLLTFMLPATVPAQKKGLIGYRHKGVVYGAALPNGAKDLGGGLLSDENYGVSRFSKSGKFMLWLERLTARDAEGIPSWEVKDVLTFSKLKKNQEFLLSYSSNCERSGKKSLDLIVLAEFSPKKKTYQVKQAWRASVKQEKFEKISTRGIECTYVEP